jgi:hypothetical protein
MVMANTLSKSEADVLELHASIRNDSTGVIAQEIIATIQHSVVIVQTRMRQKLPYAEFRAAEQLADALRAAEQVVGKVWESMHGKPLQ